MFGKTRTSKAVLFTLLLLVTSVLASAQDLVISPSPLYLGKIPIGSTSEREVIIFNTTASTITINSMSVTGTDASAFAIIDNPGSVTLGPIENRAVSIRYTPSAAEKNTAIFNVQSSAGNFTDSLIAYGIPPSGGVQAFERIIGTSEPDGASNIKQTSDGGFIISGSTTPEDEDFSSLYLMKTDVYGKVEWTSVYGDDNGADSGSDVVQVSDGGYLVVGTTENWGEGGTDIMLVKFNSSGEFQWRKTYGSENNDGGTRIIPVQGGGFALLGQTVPSSGIGKNAFLVKVDNEGNEQWRETYGGNEGTDASDIIQISDGSFFIVGFITVGSDFQV